MNLIRRVYDYSIQFLTKTVKAAIVLSHGALHLLVLLFLAITVSVFFFTTNKQDTIDVQSVNIDFHDESQMIKLTTLYGNIYLLNDNEKGDYYDLGAYFNLDSTNLQKYLKKFNGHDFDYDNNIHAFVCSISSDTLLLDVDCESIYNRSYAWYYTFYRYNDAHAMTERYVNHHYPHNSVIPNVIKSNEIKLEYPSLIGSTVLSLFTELYFPFTFHAKKRTKSETSTKAFFIGLKSNFTQDLSDDSFINIYFNKPDFDGNKTNKAFDIKYAYPQPDIITPTQIAYTNKESINLIFENKGIYFIVDNVTLRNKSNRDSIRNTVLMGAVIAFIFDIIVDLILKWRRLKKPRKRLNSVKKRKKR